ncbi:hypothetical protein AHiyo4_16990 [Arthrobacter sp. Hiyo4]|nr:hypothetical protein AHiyo4_16990 [Arthrobacter sp. Hiyo4]
MATVDSKNAVAFKVRAISFRVSVTLHDGVAPAALV